MALFQDRLLGFLKLIGLLVWLVLLDSQLDHLLSAGKDNLLFEVLNQSFHKRCPNTLNSLFKPHVIVEEVAFARQDTQVDGEVIILAVDDLEEGVFDLLGDVKHS